MSIGIEFSFKIRVVEFAVGHLARLDQLAMQCAELESAQKIGGLVERAVGRR